MLYTFACCRLVFFFMDWSCDRTHHTPKNENKMEERETFVIFVPTFTWCRQLKWQNTVLSAVIHSFTLIRCHLSSWMSQWKQQGLFLSHWPKNGWMKLNLWSWCNLLLYGNPVCKKNLNVYLCKCVFSCCV